MSSQLRRRPQPSESSPPPPPSKPTSYPFSRRLAAWLVHLYTATGLLVNLYSVHTALFRAPNFSLFAKLNWLAILIDATDGTLARYVDVKSVVPDYDGAGLDNIIDFQTFSFLPALSISIFEIVPGFRLQFIVASAILIASAYQFCQTLAKTSEAFVGFPSYWNIVVFYLYYLRPSTSVTLVVIFSCAILSFIPIHFVYPTRTKTLHAVNLGGAYLWAVLMLIPTFFPDSPHALTAIYISFLYVVYYIAISLFLDRRRRRSS